MVLTPATPALADCSAHHTNVEGYDQSGSYYGNKAFIYVNTDNVINGLQAHLYRSLFILVDLGNDVEVGWTANNGGHSGPTVYAEWVNRGTDSGPKFYTGYQLKTDNDYRFFIENVGHIKIFRFYVDGESTPFNYSPTMNFNTGVAIGNSEHWNTCDSLWAHFYALGHFRSDGTWHDYDSLYCWANTSGGNWLFNKISVTEFKVDQDTGSSC